MDVLFIGQQWALVLLQGKGGILKGGGEGRGGFQPNLN